MYTSSNAYLFELIGLCSLCVSGGEPYSERLARLREGEAEIERFPTLLTLKNVFGLSDCGTFCVMLSLGCELDGNLRNRMQELCGSPIPSFDAAFAIWSREHALLPDAFIAEAHPASPLSRFILSDREASAALLCAPIRLRASILCYLTSGQIPDTRLYGFFPLFEALPLHQPEFLRISGFAGLVRGGEAAGYIYLRGKDGSGRRSLAARIAAGCGMPLICVDMRSVPIERDAAYRLGCELAADAALSGAAVYVADCGPEHAEHLRRLAEFLPERGFLLFAAGGDGTEPPYLAGRPAFVGNVGTLSREDLWLAMSGFGVDPLPESIPDHLQLSLTELAQVLRDSRERATARGEERFTANDFALSARETGGRITSAQTVETGILPDDIILAPETREKLDLLCRFIRKSGSVREEWGFSPLCAYGEGIVGLFCGASGTGKTMAASAIANSLGLRLARIDLSRIFDKYIGETEKRLAQLFEEAKSQNCVLFFDEADALFSKRTDVSSSHDRYANVETSFLLQCIEAFSGVTILSTNLFQNFDEAFMRRITVIVKFSMPDEALRYDMWRKFFPPQTPLAGDVDLRLLANELELSPAVIKSAAFTAAVLASGDGDAVAMRHILSALKNELGKWGKESMLGELEALL